MAGETIYMPGAEAGWAESHWILLEHGAGIEADAYLLLDYHLGLTHLLQLLVHLIDCLLEVTQWQRLPAFLCFLLLWDPLRFGRPLIDSSLL